MAKLGCRTARPRRQQEDFDDDMRAGSSAFARVGRGLLGRLSNLEWRRQFGRIVMILITATPKNAIKAHLKICPI